MYNVGIDLGGTNIKVGIADKNYKIIGRSNIKTNLPRPENEIIGEIAEGVKLACLDASVSLNEINSIGIGTPGVADRKTGTVLYSSNLGFKDTKLGALLSEKLGKPVFVENDANAAAYGEALCGAGKGYSDIVVITLGTGVGSGIIIGGKIYAGFNYCGGEIGHTVIEYGGLPCPCGRNGCFESYSSATALIRATKEAMKADKSKQSVLWKLADNSLDNVDGKTAFDGMRLNDKTAERVVGDYINYLGCGLTNVINIFQPEILLIGGGICKEGDSLIKPLEEYIKRECYCVDAKRMTKLDTAKMGNDAGIIGAAFLSINN